MAGVRFTDLQSRPMEFLDFTSVTLDEFQQLVPPFETAFHARMAAWRMDGKPRTARRFSVYNNCPLPTPEDRLLFILVSLKTYALQVVHGRLCGMVQGKAHQWIPPSCPHYWRRSAPSAMPPPAPSRPWPSASVSQRPMSLLWSSRWRRSPPLSLPFQPPRRPPPLCP
jgi:hypothetical protein